MPRSHWKTNLVPQRADEMREVNNSMGKQFARYISFTLTNGQTNIIHTTGLKEKEWAMRL
uniref:Uncharacterized protein n=1 Tax=Romanomermis culicivorax TaxID=13658 RepID=A0A915I165_ROMCU